MFLNSLISVEENCVIILFYSILFLKGTFSDEKNLKFRIGEIESSVGIDDNNSRIDYNDQAPEYKV